MHTLCIFFALPDLNAGTSSPKEIDLLLKQIARERKRKTIGYKVRKKTDRKKERLEEERNI